MLPFGHRPDLGTAIRHLGLACCSLVLLVAGSGVSAAESWPGMSILNGGKGYAATPMGLVHYRDLGPRDGAPILLLHQTPMSIVEFATIQDALAQKGVRSIAVDTPGYGMSDHPAGYPTIEQFADNLVAVLDDLHVPVAVVAGHHTGATIAIAFAARHPERTAGVILHGIGLFSAAEREARLKAPFWIAAAKQREPKVDGSQFEGPFTYHAAIARQQNRQQTAAELAALTWMAIGNLQMGADTGHPASHIYDVMPNLKAIRGPGMILSDSGDSLHPYDLKAAVLRPDFEYRLFSDGDDVSLMVEPDRWAELASGFYREIFARKQP